MQSKWVKNFLVLSVAGIAMGGSIAASATVAANVTTARGDAVLDSSGECVRTTQWSPERVIHPNCAGFIAPAVATVAPPPAPAAPVAPAPQFSTTTLSAEMLFDFDSANLRPAGRETIRSLAAQLTSSDVTYTSVLVEGHTCNMGSATYNQGLSERRARSVVDYLVSQGVRPEAIRATGYGMTRPVADNSNRAGREANRRVEITTDVRRRAQ